MPREGYQEELDNLRDAVLGLGEDVLDQVDTGLSALDDHDEALAREVIGGDDRINERYLELEGDCVDLFALQQPVASDLRFVVSSFKILTDLERIGDLATNLGRYTLSARWEYLADVDVHRIGTESRDLVADALAAYAADDVGVCREVAARDDDIDALCQYASETVVRDLIERETEDGSAWSVEPLMDDVSRLLLTVRDIERIGDHAVNIAARTLYMVENDPALI